jgi:hypothetical protein
MSSLITFIFIFITTILANYSRHPISVALLLLLFAAANSSLISFLYTSWGFYILMLIFLGGVIVVVIFIVSLCRNEKFSSPDKFFPWNILALLGLIIWRLSCNKITLQPFSNNQIFLSLYQNDTRWCFMLVIATLILCIIRTVNLRKIERGPLVKRL